MDPRSTATVTIQRVRAGQRRPDQDAVVTEEPMEVRVVSTGGGQTQTHSVAVTMRTPGNDFELAAGFLLAEGIVEERDAIVDISYCPEAGLEQQYNVVGVYLRAGVEVGPELLTRNFYTTSSCGVCGKSSLEALRIRGCPSVARGRPRVRAEVIGALPQTLRASQALFERTGGLHAAGLFDAEGRLLTLREDVGRHNALDKVIGRHLLDGSLPLSDAVAVVSGRASWELMQKALAAGIPMLVAVGAPSSLAVDLATEFGMTLVGFARGEGFNIYAGSERVLYNPATRTRVPGRSRGSAIPGR